VEARVAELLAGLDERQRTAATLGPGPAQIIAPAGSGKTATLVARVGVLIAAGVPPERILVVTFNRDAAVELAQRIATRLGVTPGRDGPEVRTLHALARQVLRDGLSPPELVPDRLPRLRRARREVLTSHGLDVGLPTAEELDGIVSAAILEGREPDEPVRSVVAAYRRGLAADGAVDFDGLLAESLHRLQTDGALRARWQSRFAHVLVDEFQDVDATQLELAMLLAEPERNLMVVGDDDQTIYAWRLADVRRILEFPRRFPDATRIVLETNYRCPPSVITAADRLIAVNRERVPKALRAPATAAGAAPVIHTWPLQGPDATSRLAGELPGWADGGRLAVLARTRAELAPLALALVRAGIPHASAIPAPVSSEVVTQLLDRVRGDSDRPAFAALREARAAMGWNRGDPSEALGEEAHAALDAALGWAVGSSSVGELLAGVAAARERLAALQDPDAPIELATVHGAKGREWPVVVVFGLEIDRFPNQRSLDDALDSARALEEERRLAYVAVTRCRDRLILAFDPDRPSPFVGELLGRPGMARGRPRRPPR
jgi:superfamily I DNA/RNA helicase